MYFKKPLQSTEIQGSHCVCNKKKLPQEKQKSRHLEIARFPGVKLGERDVTDSLEGPSFMYKGQSATNV